ncbi:MAG TPA: 50S ribosomal protein L4 [Patescibacteria group bacterium]
MTKTAVYNQAGEKVTELDLNPKIFGLEKIDIGLVHTAVRAQQNNQRNAIAHTKNRGEVAGSGKKPWKQKGTGRARAGSVRSPLWRHGGVTFGPTSSRNWSVKLNQSMFRKALFTVLTDKVNEHKLVIVENFDKLAKTKELASRLGTLASKAGLGKKYLLVLDTYNKELERSSRNLPNAKVIYANQLNVLDLMKYDALILKEALPIIEKTYLK